MGFFLKKVKQPYYSERDPSRKFERTPEGMTQAQEYDAQLAIEEARSPKLGNLGSFGGKDAGRLGDGSSPDLSGMLAPGTTIGQTEAGQAAFKYEQEQAAAAQKAEKARIDAESLRGFADQYGEGAVKAVFNLLADTGRIDESLKMAVENLAAQQKHDQSVALEGVKQEDREDQERLDQTGRVALEGVKQEDRLEGKAVDFGHNKELEGIKQKGRIALEGVKGGGEGGGRPVPAKQAVDMGATLTSISQLDSMLKTTGKMDLQFGPTDIIRGFNPWDTTGKGMKQLAAATKQLIGKGLEGGVLRKEDEIKYEKIIPKLGDTKGVLQIKYTQLRDMLGEKYKGNRAGLEYADFDISKFPDVKPSNLNITKQGDDLEIGTIEDGYRYIGGNKADPNSWEKL